jgi:integrase
MQPYRPTIVEYRLAAPGPGGKTAYLSRDAAGARVTRATPGAVRRVRKSPTWWGKWRKGGRWLIRPVALSAKKETAQRLLAEKVRAVQLGLAGLTEGPAGERSRPIEEHLGEYARHLAGLNRTSGHVAKTTARVRAVLAGTGAAAAADLDPDRVTEYLSGLRKGGASVETSNHYLQAVRQFARWLRRRTGLDPLANLQALNAAVDRRRVRRALPRADVPRLLAKAAEGPPAHGLTGPQRELLYGLALGSGLRAAELASLTPASFDWEARTVTVEAAASKRRRRDVLPLRRDLAGVLWTYCASLPPGQGRLWPGAWHRRAAAMLRGDLARAGIPDRDAAGVLDFHALRHSFGTHLAEAGVHPKEIQVLMRHSTITLTMDRYVKAQDLAGAVERIAAA